MKKEDFYFNLPPELIAQSPNVSRSDSRLLFYQSVTKKAEHFQFTQLPSLLSPGDLLVLNNSRVIPARFYGTKETGGQVEFLLERILDSKQFLAHVRSSKTPKLGALIKLNEEWQVEILEKKDNFFVCRANDKIEKILNELGQMPLPPYIKRKPDHLDADRYQTIYAKHDGSVAAPTAGLHFDEELLQILSSKGINIAYTTLHVGTGTFQPVRAQNISDHVMHSERYAINSDLIAQIKSTRDAGKRIIAVGTTALRSLESAAQKGDMQEGEAETNIFIYPGFKFKVCNGLITNFHLPESTLLMLVCAFIGYENAMAMYKVAIEKSYRFFSYGDACLLLP